MQELVDLQGNCTTKDQLEAEPHKEAEQSRSFIEPIKPRSSLGGLNSYYITFFSN
jgi:hypothetical protein